MNIKEQIAVMQAFSEGKKIEMSVDGGRTWKANRMPVWNWGSCTYRVANFPIISDEELDLYWDISKELVVGRGRSITSRDLYKEWLSEWLNRAGYKKV